MTGPTLPLLVEIGCEEIPARFLQDAEDNFCRLLADALADAGLCETALQIPHYHTPRRLVAHVPALLAKQADLIEEVTGPPLKLAFDAGGRPTRAAESFAAKNGVRVEDLLQVETPKGPYIAARKRTLGRPAEDVLGNLLPQVIQSITFPKSMTWERAGVRFVRPIRWLLALLGEWHDARTVRFELAGVTSGNHTRGHRSAISEVIGVEGFADYARKLRQHYVEPDPEVRRQSIRAEFNVLVEDWMDVVPDAALEDWIVNSTEWPTALRGGFDERFLRLPREILVTVMRNHQKYFAVEDSDGALLPHFVTLINRDRDPTGTIRGGHERVLAARFSDAEFFWNSDQKIPLPDRLPMLERVTYQAKLGSYGDKVRRMRAIAERVCTALEEQGKLTSGQRAHALRAVELCKCDLTTQMVQEFTELQGVVGGLYTQAQGEPEEVWQAIYDHYKPLNVEDECPRSMVGAVVSLSDKLDAVIAGFSAGLEPTGSSDPFGLRRAGNGIVKIAIESTPELDFHKLGRNAHQESEQLLPNRETGAWKPIESFLTERLAFYLDAVARLKYDTIRGVLSQEVADGWNVPSRVLERARALEAARQSTDFQALAAAAKRTRNILTKSAKKEDFGASQAVAVELLKLPEERELYDSYQAARGELDNFEASSDYAGAFRRLAKLRPAVDRFFDRVMVMDADPVLRANRLRLLSDLDALAFRRFADLSEIETGSASKS